MRGKRARVFRKIAEEQGFVGREYQRTREGAVVNQRLSSRSLYQKMKRAYQRGRAR